MGMVDSFSQLIFNIYEAFTVALFVKDGENLKCLSSVTFANSFDKSRGIPIEGTLPGWVIKHNEPLIIPNFDKEEDTLGYYGTTEGIKSFMGYPMEGDGVIVVDSKRKWVFTDKEKKILGNFATVIRQEIEREKRYQEIDEKNEELYVERRMINLFNELNLSKVSINEIFKEALNLSGADFCFVGMERNGRMFVHEVYGISGDEYIMKECPPGNSIASIVMEGGRELLLPYNSGYLREKPLLFQGEAIKARQFFGFPLITGDVPLGAVGFVSLSELHLKEQSIGVLRDISTFLSLYYTFLWMKENLEKLKDFEPVTGSIQFPSFLGIVEKIIKKGDRFSLLSVKLSDLKVYNKRMGYEFTNSLLKKVFQIIRYCVGNNALIARKGGGHFYVLFRGSEMVEIKNVLKVLNYTISKGISEDKALDRSATVESGMSSFPEDGKSLWELLDKAEEKIK
jgi:diguanylate cyclase (GGDEF)-like protein